MDISGHRKREIIANIANPGRKNNPYCRFSGPQTDVTASHYHMIATMQQDKRYGIWDMRYAISNMR